MPAQEPTYSGVWWNYIASVIWTAWVASHLAECITLPAESGVGCRIHTTKVSLTETFMTSVQELYNTLTSQEVGASLVPGQHDHSSLVTRERRTPTIVLFSLSEAEN